MSTRKACVNTEHMAFIVKQTRALRESYIFGHASARTLQDRIVISEKKKNNKQKIAIFEEKKEIE